MFRKFLVLSALTLPGGVHGAEFEQEWAAWPACTTFNRLKYYAGHKAPAMVPAPWPASSTCGVHPPADETSKNEELTAGNDGVTLSYDYGN